MAIFNRVGSKIRFVSLTCLALIMLGSLCTLAQDEVKGLKNKRVTIQMTNQSLFTVINRLINKYDIAIGFEESILDRDHRDFYFDTNIISKEWMPGYGGDKQVPPPTLLSGNKKNLITVNFENTRLEDVLDSIVKQMENYGWEMQGSIVNIFPIHGRDSRLKELLEIEVSDFYVGEGAYVGSVQAQLMLFLPEFKAFLSKHSLEMNISGVGSIDDRRILPTELRFSTLSFRDLLNGIAKSKRGGWIIRIKKIKDQPGKDFIEIEI